MAANGMNKGFGPLQKEGFYCEIHMQAMWHRI